MSRTREESPIADGTVDEGIGVPGGVDVRQNVRDGPTVTVCQRPSLQSVRSVVGRQRRSHRVRCERDCGERSRCEGDADERRSRLPPRRLCQPSSVFFPDVRRPFRLHHMRRHQTQGSGGVVPHCAPCRRHRVTSPGWSRLLRQHSPSADLQYSVPGTVGPGDSTSVSSTKPSGISPTVGAAMSRSRAGTSSKTMSRRSWSCSYPHTSSRQPPCGSWQRKRLRSGRPSCRCDALRRTFMRQRGSQHWRLRPRLHCSPLPSSTSIHLPWLHRAWLGCSSEPWKTITDSRCSDSPGCSPAVPMRRS